MRRTSSFVVLLCGITLFLTGCLVGAGLQVLIKSDSTESRVVAQLTPQPEAAIPSPPIAEPLVVKPVKTFLVRADGTMFIPGDNNP